MTEKQQQKNYRAGGGLAIRLNNTGTCFPCAICGESFEARVGPEAELSNISAPVCRNCVRRFEPELAKVLATYENLLAPTGAADWVHFGVCAKCWYSDGHLNVGKVHFGICHPHRVYWSIGSNLFTAWRHETEETWAKNQRLLSTYRKVESVIPGAPQTSAPEDAASDVADEDLIPF